MNFKQFIKAAVPVPLHGKIRKIFIDPFIEVHLFFSKPFTKTFLICSFGGSGSRILGLFIKHANVRYRHRVKHVHDRFPPRELTAVEVNHGKSVHSFSSKKVNPKRYQVVFIFRSPSEALISVYRRFGKEHCFNIDGDWERFPDSIDDYARLGVDLMHYHEYFDAYTKGDGRNYEIICINYNKMWDNLEAVLKALKLPASAIRMFPKKQENKVNISHKTTQKLTEMYKDLSDEIDRFPEVTIIAPKKL